MKKVQLFLAALIVIATCAFVLVPASTAGAVGALDGACENNDSALCQDEVKNKSADSLIKTVINALLFIVGAISILMIIIGGILYVVSQGDSGSVTKAKNTILYSVIGLIVALLAYAIVNFVLIEFFK